MIITEIIEKKRDGQVLKPEEIDFMINGLVNGEVADYQMTSFMMAVCCRGMNETETAALTKAMIDSGNTIDLSDVPGIKVDKHSTGGVGDTTTLVVAPLVAACGGTVAKMSGRGLAHSGGTLDEQMMYNTFNMGIGMVLAVDPEDVDAAMKAIRSTGDTPYVIGHIENGEKGVQLC